MNKQKILAVFWLTILFASGLLAGSVLSPTPAHADVFSMGRLDRESPPENRWVEQHRQLLVSELDLTEEQLSRIDPVYERSTERLRLVRETMASSIKEVVRENRRGLIEILTPEQVTQFKAVLKGETEVPQS